MTGTANPDESQPYAPEGADAIGRPPMPGQVGERGTNTFEGNDEFNADGTLKADVTTPSQGPARGVDYYQQQHPQEIVTGVSTPSRESSTNPRSQ